MLDKVYYRTWQVWKTLTESLSSQGWEEVKAILTRDQLSLFRRMSEAEQAHSLRVLHALKEDGFQDPDLLTAALLHDVGKSRYPLKLWEKVWVVLVPGLPSKITRELGANRGSTLRSVIVSERHPRWGAEMALSAGVSPRAAWFIHNHEREDIEEFGISNRVRLLKALIKADSQN